MDLVEHGTSRRGDLLCALALAVVLCAGWAWRDWASLSTLRLPDTDDMMRLQQIRDWIAGQGFADVSQHRLGAAPGVPMHWSRLPDLVPAGLILALTPLFGAAAAELSAVILWPTMLFAGTLWLTARIARVLGGAAIARTAAVVAAVAFPATTVFLPGRIDHHGFQLFLLLIVVRALVARPTMEAGLIAGLAAAASLVIGLETAPVFAGVGLAMAIAWLRARSGADDRMMGFGIGLGTGLLAASIVFRTSSWGYAGCDGFTMVAWRAGVIAAFAPMGMALAARDIARPLTRAVLGGIIVGLIAIGMVMVAPQCLSPYGLVDPLLIRLWLSQVGEAQPLLATALPIAIGYGGVMMAGVAASAWQALVTRDARWASLLLVQLAALALSCLQVRGAYAGAILAAPGLAAVIAAARARGTVWLAGAWVASAGMLYPIAAQAFVARSAVGSAGPASGTAACTSPAALATLKALPPGRLMAPLDLGAYAIGATHLSVVGAPYHRNNVGNLAVYRFFLGRPEQAAAIARAWDVRYVALCGAGLQMAGAGSMTRDLVQRRPPAWLRAIARSGEFTVYAVEPSLFAPRSVR